MSAPNKQMVVFMLSKGYEQSVALASRLGVPSVTLVTMANKLGGESQLKVGRFHFLHAATLEAAVAEAAKKRAEAYARRVPPVDKQKWPTRAIGPGGHSASLERSRSAFWDHLRKIVQEELRAVLKDYEIVVQREYAEPSGPIEPATGVIVNKDGA